MTAKLDEIRFRTDYRPTPRELAHVFESSGIKRPVTDFGRLEKMIANANVFITAWAATEIVGVARGLSDFSYCCYLSDLAVVKNWQRMGVGKGIISYLRSMLGDEVAIILVAAEGASSYYAHAGFEKIPAAFRIPRRT